MQLRQYIPILDWLPGYNKEYFKGDLAAGITVGVMLIPQGMAYAMIAGLPPIIGLYASTIPLVLYAIFGTSRQLAVGPVAMVSLLTAAGVGAIAELGSTEYIALALTLALMVGAIQFLFGVFRLGFLVNFLSHPVVSGFTSAAALIIGLSQLKHLLGVNIPRSHHINEIIAGAIERYAEINWVTVAIGLAGIALIVGLKRLNKAIPGALVAVILGIGVVSLFGLSEHGVKVVGEVPKGLPELTIPAIEMSSLTSLLPIALTIAFVGLMESIAVAKAMQARHKNYKVSPNQELIALGISNFGAAFFQGYPVTGGFSRTAVNDQAGAKTGMSSIVSAVLIVLTLLFLTPLFKNLPNAILAAVIMVAVFGLIDIKEAVYLWKTNKADLAVLVVTFLATLSLGIETGILVGVVLSLGIVIYKASRPHVAVLGQIPGSRFYRNIERFTELKERDDILIVRPDAQLFFANVSYLKEYIDEEVDRKGETLKAFILNAESMNAIDSTGFHLIEELHDEFRSAGIQFYLCGLNGPVRDKFAATGYTEKIGADNFFMSVKEAVDWFDRSDKSSNELKYKEFVTQAD